MASYSKVIICGHLTRDPEQRNANGMSITKFGIAHNNKVKGEDRPCFTDCTAFGKTAEIIAQHLKKGSAVLVEGSLHLDQWDDKASGAKRSKHVVNVDKFAFLGGGREQPAPTHEEPEPQPQKKAEIPF